MSRVTSSNIPGGKKVSTISLKSLFFAFILSLASFPVIVFASTDAKDNMSPDMSPYAAYRIVKPQNFGGLQQWVGYNYVSNNFYSVHYLPETLENVVMDDGKRAVAFETWNHDHYVRNTLVDAGQILMLYTVSDPEFIPQQTDNEFIVNVNSSASACNNSYKCNCVLWVRNCKASWLPTGMTYIWEKKIKINTSDAKAGRVAVMDIYYPYGHVGYITKVSGSKISMDEANYSPCKVTSRTGTKSSMKIVGYVKK